MKHPGNEALCREEDIALKRKSSVNHVGAGILPSGLSRRENGFWLSDVVVINDRSAGTSPTVALNVVH